MGRETLHTISKKRTSKFLQRRNRESKFRNNKFRLTDLTFKDIEIHKDEIASFLPMLYNGLKQKYPSIKNVDIQEGSSIYRVLETIENFLRDRFKYSNINFIEDENGKRIFIYKEFDLDNYLLWFLFLENIFKIQYKNPKLFKILLGFISQLPIYNGEISADAEETLKEHISDEFSFCNIEREMLTECAKNNAKVSKYCEKGKKIDFKKLLYEYHPKKELTKDIKKCLMDALNIDFYILLQFENYLVSERYKYGRRVNFLDLFGIYYKDGHYVQKYIIQDIETNYGEYGMTSPMDILAIDESGITKNFNLKQQDINKITSFIEEFGGLISKL